VNIQGERRYAMAQITDTTVGLQAIKEIMDEMFYGKKCMMEFDDWFFYYDEETESDEVASHVQKTFSDGFMSTVLCDDKILIYYGTKNEMFCFGMEEDFISLSEKECTLFVPPSKERYAMDFTNIRFHFE
jgi:hypothetical protein